MQLTLRLWREQIECDAPGLATSEERWIIRKQRPRNQRQQRQSTRKGKAPVATQSTLEEESAAKESTAKTEKFAERMKHEWCEISARFKWSPWHVPAKRGEASGEPGDHEGEKEVAASELGLLRAWRLRSNCLRVATFYRVMHSHERAATRRRREISQGRFQKWATSVIQERRDAAAQQAADDAAEERRRGSSSQPRTAAGTRKGRMSSDVYTAGTRTYKARAPKHIMNERLLAMKHRTQITSAAEIGPRLHETFMEIARRCYRERADG